MNHYLNDSTSGEKRKGLSPQKYYKAEGRELRKLREWELSCTHHGQEDSQPSLVFRFANLKIENLKE